MLGCSAKGELSYGAVCSEEWGEVLMKEMC